MTVQQIEDPTYFERQCRAYLDRYLQGQWIGRHSLLVCWILPEQLITFGYPKSKLYAIQPKNFEVLRQRFSQVCRSITSEIFANIRRDFCRDFANKWVRNLSVFFNISPLNKLKYKNTKNTNHAILFLLCIKNPGHKSFHTIYHIPSSIMENFKSLCLGWQLRYKQ